ncbi:MAG: dihydropteroate synthase [Gemmatimonadaceae bacterium]|nr:dihydropteroate synthase [Gemmatimonadaceae bacterium]
MLPITVAALMTTEWIAKHLEVPEGTDLVLIPGLCEGATASISDRFTVRVEKGPKDLREIPEFFGQAAAREDYGACDIEIIAEINNAPRLARADIVREALRFRDSGADYIDIGCTPGLAFPELGDVVRELVAAGIKVSIDTFNADEIRTAVDAGATLVLSINGSNLELAPELAGRNVRVVALPDFGAPLETITPTLERLDELKIPYLIDPIIEPIGFGFMASLERYAEARRRWPDAEMMMGIGNITELTAADSTGINAILIAICQELGVRAVLTTEVIPWAHGSVREIDIARRLMHHSITKKIPPKRVDTRLVTIKDSRILEYGEAELRELQSRITDPNFRIFTDRDTITVLNRDLFVRGTDIQEIFAQLGVDEPTHAFYLGKELAKAKLAITLGKTYRQEGSLSWGYLTPPDDLKSEHVKLTQHSRRSATPKGEPPAI